MGLGTSERIWKYTLLQLLTLKSLVDFVEPRTNILVILQS